MKTQFVFTGQLVEQGVIDALANQAKQIVIAVKNSQGPLDKQALENLLSTDGSGKRVLSYYKSKLVGLGLIREEIADLTLTTGQVTVKAAKYGTLGRSAVVVSRVTAGYQVWLFEPDSANQIGHLASAAEALLSKKDLQLSADLFDEGLNPEHGSKVFGKPIKWMGAKTAARSAASKKIVAAA